MKYEYGPVTSQFSMKLAPPPWLKARSAPGGYEDSRHLKQSYMHSMTLYTLKAREEIYIPLYRLIMGKKKRGNKGKDLRGIQEKSDFQNVGLLQGVEGEMCR